MSTIIEVMYLSKICMNLLKIARTEPVTETKTVLKTSNNWLLTDVTETVKP